MKKFKFLNFSNTKKLRYTDNYFKEKLEQTIEFLKKNFFNKEGFLGSAYDADSDGEEGKYYVYSYDEIKNI